jgi:pimeloyl-ACP methyl ester carboxylesterase
MALEVILPRVDMDMTSGRISRWHVAEGEPVEKGQPLFEIETDKAAMEIEAPGAGIVRGILAAADTAIPVGSTVAWIYGAGETVQAEPTRAAVTAEPHHETATPAPARRDMVEALASGVTATPLARRLARQHDIALDRIAGSGPRRRIQARDVTALAVAAHGRTAAKPVVPPPAAAREADGIGLHRAWLRQGEGRPLVLIHGFGAELNGWRPLVASLAPGRPILAVDLPGHGHSPAAAAPSLEGFAAAVADTLAAEGIASADLIGHSLGAAVAACLADTAAFELRSLLLISPAGLGPDINGAFLDGFTRARSEASLGPWLRLLVSDEAVLGQGFVRATARARADEAVVAAQAQMARALFPDGTQAFSIRESLARIGVPVRVVFGADDRIIPARHAFDLPGGVALHLFRGVGHMPHLEVRPALARILGDHLR